METVNNPYYMNFGEQARFQRGDDVLHLVCEPGAWRRL